MKVRIELDVDTTTGAYDVRFNNISQPGHDIDLVRLMEVVQQVLGQVQDRAVGPARAANDIVPVKVALN